MLRGNHSTECSGSEYYIEVVPMRRAEVARMRVVAVQETSLADMDRGGTQVAAHICME